MANWSPVTGAQWELVASGERLNISLDYRFSFEIFTQKIPIIRNDFLTEQEGSCSAVVDS